MYNSQRYGQEVDAAAMRVVRDATTGAKTISAAAPSTIYSFGTISSLTVSAITAPGTFTETVNNVQTTFYLDAEYVFEFTLGSTVGAMSFPIAVVWVDGRPEWKANKHYRVVVLYNAGDDHYFAYCEGTLGALGTAARKNVPTSGNASSSQVVMGNDTRLTNSRTPTSHTHGNIQNTGALQSSDVTIANGDKLVITDSSDSDKVARASVAFDGSTKTKALTKNGTFETFVSTAASQGLSDTEKSNARANIGAGTSSFSGSYNDLTDKPTIPTIPASLPANGGNSNTVNGHTVNSDVPADAVFTDTNTWRPLGTGSDDACAGNDSRLSDARKASNIISSYNAVSSNQSSISCSLSTTGCENKIYYNSGSSDITLGITTNANTIAVDGVDSITLGAGKYAEINFIRMTINGTTKIFIRSVSQ